MTWTSSITPEDPHETYKTGEESRARDPDFNPLTRQTDVPSWPRWSEYRKKDLSEFPGVTGRIGRAEGPGEADSNGEEPINADD